MLQRCRAHAVGQTAYEYLSQGLSDDLAKSTGLSPLAVVYECAADWRWGRAESVVALSISITLSS